MDWLTLRRGGGRILNIILLSYSNFQIRSQTYKLPPDVELSKSPPNTAEKSSRSDDCAYVPPKKRTVNLDRLQSSGEHFKSEPSPTQLNEEFKHLQKNGHVTLSRWDHSMHTWLIIGRAAVSWSTIPMISLFEETTFGHDAQSSFVISCRITHSKN